MEGDEDALGELDRGHSEGNSLYLHCTLSLLPCGRVVSLITINGLCQDLCVLYWTLSVFIGATRLRVTCDYC